MPDSGFEVIDWSLDEDNPVIVPGAVNGKLDALHAGAAHVFRLADTYHLYYWAIGADGVKRICRAVSEAARPNDWRGLGAVLEPQPGVDYNCGGPSFPFVIPSEDDQWLMYFGAWGRPRRDGKLPNSTGLAVSRNGGNTWTYYSDRPIIPLDRPCDCEGTGSVCVLKVGREYRMYYTSIGKYIDRPEGVQTGHGKVIPQIGIGYAVSEDGIHWIKPLEGLMISARGFGVEPYEYICSKPFVIPDGAGYRMWVSTFGPAYRIRSLVSSDGLHWTWVPSGPDGELGVGEPGAFDDHQRSYASVVRHGDEYLMWYTGNGFGMTGMGFAVGRAKGCGREKARTPSALTDKPRGK